MNNSDFGMIATFPGVVVGQTAKLQETRQEAMAGIAKDLAALKEMNFATGATNEIFEAGKKPEPALQMAPRPAAKFGKKSFPSLGR